MTHFQAKLDTLKRDIDHITQFIMEKLELGTLEDVDSQLTKRSTLLTELISLAANEISKGEVLRDYLVDLQKRDQVIVKALSKEKQDVQNTISNFNKLDKYFNV